MQCRNRDADVLKLGLTFLHCINSYAGPSCLHKLVHRAMGQTKSSSDLVPHESTYLRDSRLRGESRAWSRLLLPDDNWLPVLCGGWRVGSTSFTGTWDRWRLNAHLSIHYSESLFGIWSAASFTECCLVWRSHSLAAAGRRRGSTWRNRLAAGGHWYLHITNMLLPCSKHLGTTVLFAASQQLLPSP